MSSEEQRDNRESYPNLIRFKPGQSGNPGGRPKGQSVTSILREVADFTSLRDMPLAGGRTASLALAESMFIHAIEGNATFAGMILDRLDGKAPQTVDDSTTDADVTDTMADAMIQAGLKAKGVAGGPDS